MLTVLCESYVTKSAPGYVCRVLCNLRLAMGYVEERFVLCLQAHKHCDAKNSECQLLMTTIETPPLFISHLKSSLLHITLGV